MREIKFRAWRTEEKYMVTSDRGVLTAIQHCYAGKGLAECPRFSNINNQPRSGRYNLMQYTGLNDKNEKESFEHDIIKINIHNGLYSEEWIAEIIFIKGQFGIRYGGSYKAFYPLATFFKPTKKEYISNVGEIITESEPMFEVIGNTYENPELLGDTP